jgi:hypothetical protein
MTGIKTSIHLQPGARERWKATGLSLTEIVDRGLDAAEPEPVDDKIRRIIREEVSLLPDADEVRRIVADAIRDAAMGG